MGPNDLFGFNPNKGTKSTKSDKNLQYKGLPFEGKAYHVEKDNLPVQGKTVSTKQFNVAEEKELIEYNSILQRVANGTAVISFEERVYEASIKSWIVLIRWIDIAYVAPNKKGKGV